MSSTSIKEKLRPETIGEILIVLEITLFSLFPLIITSGISEISKLMFLGVTHLLAAPFFFGSMIVKRKVHEVKNRQAWPYILIVALLVVVFPSTFLSFAANLADSITIAIFLQSELFFAFIFCGLIFKESITLRKTIGALIALTGAIIILYQGTLAINLGALYVIIGSFFYPFGNMSAKKSMNYVSSVTVLFLRSIIGGPILIALSLFLDPNQPSPIPAITANILPIIFTVIAINFISKIFWYEGIKRIEISKAASINTALPALSTVFTFLIFGIFPTTAQFIGLILVITGLSQIVYKREKARK